MLTKNDPKELLQVYPEELQDFFLAVSVLSKRICSLPKADQNDLIELVFAQSRADDEEERRNIRMAMVEILTGALIVTRPIQPSAAIAVNRGTENWARHVGGKIKEARVRAGLTQTQLAEKADLPQSHISRLENAEYSATHHTLTKIARALGIDVGAIDPCAD